jgi:hypothetical protein
LSANEFPSPEQLEEQGVRIGKITIESQNIFDLDNPHENKSFYRLANKLHVVTRPQVIESQLLFAEGDTYTLRVVEESERLLRQNVYLREVDIEPVRIEDGVIDLQVRTADVWSLTPSVTAGRAAIFGPGATLSSRCSFSWRSTA